MARRYPPARPVSLQEHPGDARTASLLYTLFRLTGNLLRAWLLPQDWHLTVAASGRADHCVLCSVQFPSMSDSVRYGQDSQLKVHFVVPFKLTELLTF